MNDQVEQSEVRQLQVTSLSVLEGVRLHKVEGDMWCCQMAALCTHTRSVNSKADLCVCSY